MTTLDAASAELALDVPSRINSKIIAVSTKPGEEPVKSTVTVVIPPAAMPGIATVVILSAADMSEFLQLAPAPSGQTVLTAVFLGSFGAGDEPIELKQFVRPVELTLVIPAVTLPDGEKGQKLVIAHWDGKQWTDLPTKTHLAGFDVELTVELSHFSTYAVLYNGGSAPKPAAATGAGTFSARPIFSPGGQAFVVFAGGTSAQLEAAGAAAEATGVWVQNGAGKFFLLVIRGPEFLRREFDAAFPTGFAGTTAMTLVRS